VTESGARRAIEWFLGNAENEPSDSDLVDLHCFLRRLVARIDAGEEMSLGEWEAIRRPSALRLARPLN
jgi:hypothetical protein